MGKNNKNQVKPLVICRDNFTKLPDGEYIDCSNCPCRNSDYEEGANCNLGYDFSYVEVGHQRLLDISANCELVEVRYSEQKEIRVFVPKKVIIKSI